MKKPSEGIDITTFLRDVGLYEEYSFDSGVVDAIRSFEGTIDLYCVECDAESVFSPVPESEWSVLKRSGEKYPVAEDKGPVFTLRFRCSRNEDHIAAFVFRVVGNSISKIGQFPSIADLRHREKREYRKILGDQYDEYARALGLHAHGIGIGSFVYLRRIFEGLVEDAAQKKKQQDPSWDIDCWRKLRMDEKIDHLDDLLPSFLIENSSIYPILSKGIHQLSEEECKKYFPVVCKGIELILGDKLAEQEKTRLRKDMADGIARIKGEIK